MPTTVELDSHTNRKFFLDSPADLAPGEALTFVLNLHGGGSHGTWQHKYFPAHEYCDRFRLIVATPSSATREPTRHWVGEADDNHLQNIVEQVISKFAGQHLRAFWLAGHSQGGMTSNRLLNTDYFSTRVDGWISLSGGRIGPAKRASDAGRPIQQGNPPAPRVRLNPPAVPECDCSFIFAVGEHEIEALPTTSPWAEKYAADTRIRLDDVVDSEAGQIYDTTCDGFSTRAWGLKPKPGTAQIYLYPNAQGGYVIADIVRLDKGHTEGLEPNITAAIVELITRAPGGKLR